MRPWVGLKKGVFGAEVTDIQVLQMLFRCSVRTSFLVCLPPFCSSPLLYILYYVCVMDGLLYHTSNTNIGLSACTGSSPCKLNLSEAFFFLHTLFYYYFFYSLPFYILWIQGCVTKLASFTSSQNISFIPFLLEHVDICVDLSNTPFCLNDLLSTQLIAALFRDRRLLSTESTAVLFLFSLFLHLWICQPLLLLLSS